MIFRTAIFTSMLFITYSSYSMDIVKKITKHSAKEKKQLAYHHPIITDFLIIQIISSVNNIPQELTLIIQQYCMRIRDQNFKDNFPYLHLWNDFQIPLHYHYRLTPKQINSLQEYFKYEPSNIPYPHEKRLAMHYSLETKDDYKIFKTIPIEIRRYLTQLPQSVQKGKKINFTNTDINEHKIVQVGTCYTGIKGKYIIPEEVTKKIKLDINR